MPHYLLRQEVTLPLTSTVFLVKHPFAIIDVAVGQLEDACPAQAVVHNRQPTPRPFPLRPSPSSRPSPLQDRPESSTAKSLGLPPHLQTLPLAHPAPFLRLRYPAPHPQRRPIPVPLRHTLLPPAHPPTSPAPTWVASLWCDLGRCSRTVMVIKLRRTSALCSVCCALVSCAPTWTPSLPSRPAQSLNPATQDQSTQPCPP